MKKLKSIIEKAMEGSKRKLKSLYDIQEAIRVYNGIISDREVTTINSNIYNLCVECGLNTKIEGIGWKISKIKI
jgi:hypothetical protein